MPSFTIDSFTITQPGDHAALGTALIKYTYTLVCDEEDCALENSVSVKVDIKETDSGNTVASGVGAHTARCDEGYTRTEKGEEIVEDCGARVTKEIVVAASSLNQSSFTDTITITLNGDQTAPGSDIDATSQGVTVDY